MDGRIDRWTEGETLSSLCLVLISWMDECTNGETFCSILLSLPFCVNEWLHMVIFGHVWSDVAMYGHV